MVNIDTVNYSHSVTHISWSGGIGDLALSRTKRGPGQAAVHDFSGRRERLVLPDLVRSLRGRGIITQLYKTEAEETFSC